MHIYVRTTLKKNSHYCTLLFKHKDIKAHNKNRSFPGLFIPRKTILKGELKMSLQDHTANTFLSASKDFSRYASLILCSTTAIRTK